MTQNKNNWNIKITNTTTQVTGKEATESRKKIEKTVKRRQKTKILFKSLRSECDLTVSHVTPVPLFLKMLIR